MRKNNEEEINLGDIPVSNLLNCSEFIFVTYDLPFIFQNFTCQFPLIQAKVQRIHLDGLGRTKDDFVSQQVKRVFKAANFEEVKASLLSSNFADCAREI